MLNQICRSFMVNCHYFIFFFLHVCVCLLLQGTVMYGEKQFIAYPPPTYPEPTGCDGKMVTAYLSTSSLTSAVLAVVASKDVERSISTVCGHCEIFAVQFSLVVLLHVVYQQSVQGHVMRIALRTFSDDVHVLI